MLSASWWFTFVLPRYFIFIALSIEKRFSLSFPLCAKFYSFLMRARCVLIFIKDVLRDYRRRRHTRHGFILVRWWDYFNWNGVISIFDEERRILPAGLIYHSISCRGRRGENVSNRRDIVASMSLIIKIHWFQSCHFLWYCMISLPHVGFLQRKYYNFHSLMSENNNSSWFPRKYHLYGIWSMILSWAYTLHTHIARFNIFSRHGLKQF